MTRTLRCALALLLLSPALVTADAKWTRVDTANFIIVGAQGEQALRDVGKQFEGFREALTRLLSGAVTSTAVPTVVVVFPDDKTLQPFKPQYQGKAVNIGGLFVPRSHVNYILLGPDRGGESLRPVFDGIDFITYRPDLQGSVTCGARTPSDRVYVTYRPGDLDGLVVAIEFLPAR